MPRQHTCPVCSEVYTYDMGDERAVYELRNDSGTKNWYCVCPKCEFALKFLSKKGQTVSVKAVLKCRQPSDSTAS